jgi:hypothetical protein
MATHLWAMPEHDPYGALLQLPAHVVGEIVDGHLHVSPRPSGPHVVAASTLIMAKTLEVYARDGEQWILLATHGGAVAVRAVPFEAIELDLAAVWGRP